MPPAFRNDKQNAKIPAKPEAAGYAFPLCTNISVQSNAENFRQLFVHKHMENGKLPLISAMLATSTRMQFNDLPRGPAQLSNEHCLSDAKRQLNKLRRGRSEPEMLCGD